MEAIIYYRTSGDNAEWKVYATISDTTFTRLRAIKLALSAHYHTSNDWPSDLFKIEVTKDAGSL